MLVVLKIPSIKDSSAAKQIEQKLLHVNGVDHLVVRDQIVKLIYDKQKTTLDVIYHALSEIGFTPEVD